MPDSGDFILDIGGLTKSFPGVVALDNIDFTIARNSIHVLVGENGAGKSTLVNIIMGAFSPDHVERLRFGGKDVQIHNPKDALKLGIAAVQQHFSLAGNMTVADNIFLNNEPVTRIGTIDYDRMRKEAEEIIGQLEVSINPAAFVGTLTASDRQLVEICKALSRKPKLLLMDEPTSGLNLQETDKLFRVIRRLKEKGLTILYISHRLEEVFKIGETVTVLRNGKIVTDRPLQSTNHQELTKLITGHEVSERFLKDKVERGETALEIAGLSCRTGNVPLRDISFSVKAGEILGIFGILGSGKDELAHCLFGKTPYSSGEIRLEGKPCVITHPREAIANGLGYLTEDRSTDGYVPFMSVAKNQTLSSLKNFCRSGIINRNAEKEVSDRYIDMLKIKTPTRETLIRSLSGGNQQKVLFSRWLIANSKVLILNEPTRGIDIGAKEEMFRLMVEQVKHGKAVCFLSSELDEILAMSDRIIVMRHGRVAGEFDPSGTTKHDLLTCATALEKEAV